MGEIKSTLDIIMEKTKGLTMTDEEKKAFKRKEVEGKVRGILQKFLDGLMDFQRLKKQVETLEDEQREMAKEYMAEECMGRIDPEVDNAPFLDILENIGGVDTQPLRKVLSEFRKDLEKRQADQEKSLRKRLKEQGILGSAVIPNIKADPEWIQYVSELRIRGQRDIALFSSSRIQRP